VRRSRLERIAENHAVAPRIRAALVVRAGRPARTTIAPSPLATGVTVTVWPSAASPVTSGSCAPPAALG